MRKTIRAVGLLVLLTLVVTASAPGFVRVRVHTGDTLGELAQRHGTTVARIKALNDRRSNTIYAGEILRLPGNSGSAAPARRSATRTVARVHVVRPGDNLTVLARRWGTTVRAVQAGNKLRGSSILIGQRLSYGVTVTSASTSGTSVQRGVTASAAYHRAVLTQRSLPTKATVKVMIRKAAKRWGVPTSLALAVAYQESGFQQRVVSPVDAIGVMQVLPSTGRSLGRLHGRSFDLLVTSDNIEAGVILLKDLLNATGSTPKALAGYYQGLGSISRKGLLPQTHAYINNIQLLQRRFA